MIDQASVFADRFRNNRQALQAAVLGQNSGVDPYTALRALQLLKESDSMQVAQQGQQPTESPSLLQEAMQQPQPQGMMPAGQPVPGQQMPQAPQQSGGLEAMPVPDQMFSGAGGGIVAFANKGAVPGPEDVNERGQDIEALQAKLTKASAAYQSAYREGTNNQKIIALMSEMQNLRGQLKSAQDAKSDNSSKSETQGMVMPGYDNPTPGKGETWDYLKRELDARNLQRGRAVDRFLTENIDVAAAAEKADAAALQAETAALGNRYPAPATSINDPLRVQEAAADISYGPPVVPAADRSLATNTSPNNGADVAPGDATAGPVNRGIGAIAQSQAMTDALTTQSAARANLGAISYNPPDAVKPQTATDRFKGAKAQIDNVKEYMGKDKYSDEARKIIEERTADLTNPDRNKFDKALAWFKGAAAMQKGRGLESIANAAAEVAGSYSVIKKEDRKEKNAIRDMNLNLTKAEQAREDGQKSTAMNWQDKAQTDKVAAAEAGAKREDARVRVETAVKGALSESADKGVSSLRTDETQNRNIDSVAETARQRNATNEKMRKLTAERLVNEKNLAAYNAAYATLMRTEADVDKAMKGDTDLQRLIGKISLYESRAAKNELDKKELAALKNSKARREKLEKKYTDRLKAATGPFNVISSRIMGAADIGAEGGAPTTDYTTKSIDKATFDSLPPDTKFMDPNGQIRTK